MIRKLAYLEAFQQGTRDHLLSFRPPYQAKKVVGLNV